MTARVVEHTRTSTKIALEGVDRELVIPCVIGGSVLEGLQPGAYFEADIDFSRENCFGAEVVVALRGVEEIEPPSSE